MSSRRTARGEAAANCSSAFSTLPLLHLANFRLLRQWSGQPSTAPL